MRPLRRYMIELVLISPFFVVSRSRCLKTKKKGWGIVGVTDRLAPTASRAVFWGDILIGGCLAALTSAHSILILCYSLVGSSGNTVFTGALLTSAMVAILTLSFRGNV